MTITDIRSLTINSFGHIFVGTSAGGVFRSTDNGDNWTPINTGLTHLAVGSLAINSIGHIFTGTWDGVFHSTDNGDHWTPINTGLTNLHVGSLAINSGGYIFAGTYGSGVYRSIQSTTAVKEINKEMPSSFELMQNYPNPFNAETEIVYQIPVVQRVSIAIYDMTGRLVKTLVNERKDGGYYTVHWNGKDNRGNVVPSGVYLYRLQTERFSKAGKALLIK